MRVQRGKRIVWFNPYWSARYGSMSYAPSIRVSLPDLVISAALTVTMKELRA